MYLIGLPCSKNSIYEQQLGADHHDTAISLNNLALLYYTQDKYDEAQPLLQQALSIAEQQLGREHPMTKTFRENSVAILRMTGQEAETKRLEEDS